MSLDTTTTPQEQDTPVTPAPVTDDSAAAPAPAATSAESEEAKPKRGRPKASAAKKTRTVELTLTVTGTADGEWQAELKHGSKWVAQGLKIPASAVSRAAKELHEDLSTPIDEVINAAVEQQKAKVAALEAELEQARQALAELDG
ncbi:MULTISPECIES: DUF6319 family protein [Amycolatopsis]|uniref:Mucin n=1 Tax=Amycolatopsis tucumanensis TaxID=401106 RepID=A0ABP7IVH3_9PSEU|nr:MULTISPECIES: DUF6319 family protein [Amycolatopsis]MCF6427349.1 DUF6319 family protein [Amycolatopsis tucumanensis]